MGLFGRIFGRTEFFRPNCFPQALCQGAAWIRQKGVGLDDVKFEVSRISEGYDHIRCMVNRDGKWLYSIMDNYGRIQLVDDPEHPEGKVYKTLSWEQLLQEELTRINMDKRRGMSQ